MSDLIALRAQLQTIYHSISKFQPPPRRLPILDSSLEFKDRDGPWIQHDNIPGLKKLKETVKVDLDALDKFLRKNPNPSPHTNSLCTNAPYLLAVWDQVLSAPPPVQIVFKTFPLERSQETDEIDGQMDENPALTEWEQKERRERKRQKREKGKDDGQEKDEQRTPGVKVDVVADYGRRWIRVNTIKNSRLLAEFRELDSYLTDSSDEDFSEEDSDIDDDASDCSSRIRRKELKAQEKHSDPNYRPTLAAKEFDNSLLRMGRALMRAAEVNQVRIPSIRKDNHATQSSAANASGNPNITKLSINDVSYTSITPHVTLRLTRLDPEGIRGPTDPRIGKTVKMLEEMGLNVVMGECELERATQASRTEVEQSASCLESLTENLMDEDQATAAATPESVPVKTNKSTRNTTTTPRFNQPIPTHKVNLDLSILLALVSDLTHAPLPTSVEEAKKRFAVMEGGKYAEWKKAVAKEKEKEQGKGKEKEGKTKKSNPKTKSNKARDKKKASARVQEEDSIDMDTDGEGDGGGNDDSTDSEHDHDPHTHEDNDETVSAHPSNPVPYITDLAKQTRALTNQVLQEMTKGLLEEMKGRLGLLSSGPGSGSAPRHDAMSSSSTTQLSVGQLEHQPHRIEFWTTPEARDRCLRIVEKIGGPGERRRARALLWMPTSHVALSVSGDKTTGEEDGDSQVGEKESLENLAQAEAPYWRDSRYGLKYLPLLPLSFYPCNSVDDVGDDADVLLSAVSQLHIDEDTHNHQTETLPPFFLALDKACSDTLEQEVAKGRWYTKYKGYHHHQQQQHPGDIESTTPNGPLPDNTTTPSSSTTNVTTSTTVTTTDTDILKVESLPPASQPPRTILTKVNPRLTPHTVQSLRWGARLGWTTLTANRTSVKAIVKEIGARRRFLEVLQIDGSGTGSGGTGGAGVENEVGRRDDSGLLDGQSNSDGQRLGQNQIAAIWIVDPRSLAEGMRADLDSFHIVGS